MTTKKQHTIPLTDYYNIEIKVGDLVLGAKAGGRFHQTSFTHAIVIGRTAHMLEIHGLGPWYDGDTQEMLASIQRRGHRGGRLNPREIIRLGSVLTEQEITTALKGAKDTSYGSQFKPKIPTIQKPFTGQPTPCNLFGTP